MITDKEKQEIRDKLDILKKEELRIKNSDKKRHDKIEQKESMRGASIGFEFIITFIVFFFIGSYLDKRYGTGPWILFASLILGLIIATYNLIRQIPKD